MTLDYPRRWTPRAIKVLSTAKVIAASTGHIEPQDLLLAFESVALDTGSNVASDALSCVGIQPSVALTREAPKLCPPNMYVSPADFGPSLTSAFPDLVVEEATAMGCDYVGIEHLLLLLARVGVPGIELPYDRIRKTILELMGKS
jgi:hypothetical protein